MSNLGEYNRNRQMRTQARAFLIWREGHAVKWDCTVRELAEATGLPVSAVAYIVRYKAWPVQPEPPAERPEERNQPLVFRLDSDIAPVAQKHTEEVEVDDNEPEDEKTLAAAE